MASAYQSRPYDRSAHTARMGDLIRARGDVQANAVAQAGQNSARMWQDVGQTVAGTMGDLIRLQQELPRQRESDERRAREAQERETQAKVGEALKQSIDPATGRLDFTKAASLIGQVDPVQAESYWQKADAETEAKTKRDGEKAREVAKRLGVVLLAAEKDQTSGSGSLQSAPVAYRSAREAALKDGLVEPDELPEEFDQAVVEQTVLEAMTAEQVFQRLWAAKPKAPQRSTKVVNNKIVDENTGEVVYAGDPEPTKRNTSVVDGRIVDIDTGKVVYASPEAGKGKDTDLTAAQRQAARDRRYDRLQDIEKLVGQGVLAPEDAERKQHEIESEYARAVGEAPPPPLRQAPSDLVASEGRTSYEAPRNATMGDLTRPPASGSPPLGAGPASAAPPPQAPPMPPQAAPRPMPSHGVPPDVAEVLAGQKPGRYRLSDGSMWVVDAQGGVSPAR